MAVGVVGVVVGVVCVVVGVVCESWPGVRGAEGLLLEGASRQKAGSSG